MGEAPAKSGVPKTRDSSHSSLTRYRKKGDRILHSKHVVICVIILTITDCALVIAELILDLYSVKKMLADSENRVERFVERLQSKYHNELTGDGAINVDHLFDTILISSIIWNFNYTLIPRASPSSSDGDDYLHLHTPSTSGHMTLHFAENRTRHRRHNYGDSSYFMQNDGVGGGVGGGGGVGVGGDGRTGTGAGTDAAPVLGGGEKSDVVQSGNLLYHALQTGAGDVLRGNWTSGNSTVHVNAFSPDSGGVTRVGAGSGELGDMRSGYSHSSATGPHGYLFHEHSMDHDPEMEVAHKLHYASLAVVSVLLVEVILKVLCSGPNFVKRKIEVFDAVIIVASFVVDLVFLNGLQAFPLDDSIFILAFLLPWRVIRVVNSLVVAVIDHEHVKLRLLYSRKKKLDKTVENLRNEVDELKGLLQDVRSFCIKEGLDAWKIDNLLGKFAPRRRKDSKFYTLVKLVMSTASVADDKDSVSSSSIENDIRAIANRDSVLNINDCSNSNENTVTSFNFLGVPGSYDSRSMSDMDSYRGGYSSHSPSQSPNLSPVLSRSNSPSGIFLRVPGGNSAFKFDDTQSLTSDMDDRVSRPCTPNILLTAPSMEAALSEVGGDGGVAETCLGPVPDGHAGGTVNGLGEGLLTSEKAAELHSPPPSPFLSVPNSHVLAGRSKISDSHSLTDLQDVSGDSRRRSSCLSLNAEAKGRRRKSPRRVNFDLS